MNKSMSKINSMSDGDSFCRKKINRREKGGICVWRGAILNKAAPLKRHLGKDDKNDIASQLIFREQVFHAEGSECSKPLRLKLAQDVQGTKRNPVWLE